MQKLERHIRAIQQVPEFKANFFEPGTVATVDWTRFEAYLNSATDTGASWRVSTTWEDNREVHY